MEESLKRIVNVDGTFRKRFVGEFAIHGAVRLHMDRQFPFAPHNHGAVGESPGISFVEVNEGFAAEEDRVRITAASRFIEAHVEKSRREPRLAVFGHDGNALNARGAVTIIPVCRQRSFDDGDVSDDLALAIARQRREDGRGVVPCASRSENSFPVRKNGDKKLAQLLVESAVDFILIEDFNSNIISRHWNLDRAVGALTQIVYLSKQTGLRQR